MTSPSSTAPYNTEELTKFLAIIDDLNGPRGEAALTAMSPTSPREFVLRSDHSMHTILICKWFRWTCKSSSLTATQRAF